MWLNTSPTGCSSVNCEDLERARQKVCEILEDMNIQSYFCSCIPVFIIPHTHTHRCFSIQIHTRAYPTDSMSPSFSLHGLLVSSINVSPVYCKIGFSSADWSRCSRRVIVRSHPGQYIVLSYSKMPASSAGTLPSV